MPGSQVTVRRAVSTDCSDLTRIALSAKASWGYPQSAIALWTEELTFTAAYVQAHRVYAAVDADGRMVGTATLEEGPPPEIAHFWISPEAQGQGIGRLLANELLRVAQQCGWPALKVVSDPNAVGFYERLGGRPDGNQPAPVPDDPDRALPILRIPVPE